MGNITSQTIEGSVQGLHLQSANPGHMLGTRLETPDGRTFHYAKAGENLTIGRVVGHIAKAANLASDNIVAATAPRTTAQWDAGINTVIVATTVSATTSLHIYPNRYDDGYLWINDEAGEGQMLSIKSHGVSTSSGSTAVVFTMYDDSILTIALTTASQIGLTENYYKDVVVHTGTTGGGPALGVAPRAVTSGYYFWLQTGGPCPVMAGPDTLLAGEPAIAGISTGTSTGLAMVAGSAYPSNTTKETRDFMQPEIGFVITPATGDAEYALVYLTCAP